MKLREQIEKFMTQPAIADGRWDDQIDAYTEFVNMQLKEQRQMCADAVIQEMGGKDYAGYLLATRLNNACLNATGESDDK